MRTSANPRRRLALCVLVSVALLGSAASANATTKRAKPKPKPKPVCNLIMDPKGDVAAGQEGANEDQALDIVSADVATDSKNLTAVIRVAKLANPDLMSPQGTFYELQFTGSKNQTGQTIYVQVEPTGISYEGGAGTGVYDTVKNEIRVTLPLSYFGTGSATLVPGPAFHSFVVYADLGLDAAPLPGSGDVLGDHAESTATYTPGTPSCVAVGK